MRYGSVCSGIEAATVAWHPLGWEPQWFSEIEKFPCAVLKHHYPDIPNLGDMTQIYENQYFHQRRIELLVGGTPCQSFSVAGLRRGLADPRGNLALHFLKIADRARPRWVVWENVPGVLSSWSDEKRGVEDTVRLQTNDFETFTSGLRKLGYGLAGRIIDAQYAGVPQRRRRIFVVGYLGDWRPAVAVLFERGGLSWHSPPSQEKKEDLAPTIGGRTSGGGGLGTDADLGGALIANCLTTREGLRQDPSIETLIAGTISASGAGSARPAGQANETDFLIADTVRSHPRAGSNSVGMIALTQNQVGDVLTSDNFPSMGTNANASGRNTPKIAALAPTLRAMPNQGPGRMADDAARMSMVRRLTPRECERLQGFPDDYTNIIYRGKPAKDGPRYKAIGNSMAVPEMRWIGQRVNKVEAVLEKVMRLK